MSEQQPFTAPEGPVLGETAGARRIDGLAECSDAALSLARQARYSLRLFTRDLDRRLYSTEAFREAVSVLARRSRHTFVRILVQDPTDAIRSDHRLIGLVQHLSSHVGVRRVAPDWQKEVSAGLLADEHGLLHRPYGDRLEGTVDFAAGPRAIEYRTWFDDVWENSVPDPEFRRLGI